MNITPNKTSLLALACAVLLALPAPALAASFRFENYPSLDAMREFIIAKFPPGTKRDAMRKAFVTEGKATIITHPARKLTEKYIYDIDLCGAFMWRWNISADFGEDGKLAQAYINGKPVHMAGEDDPLVARREFGKWRKSEARKVTRYGDKAAEISYFLQDTDGDLATPEDQAVSGPGFRAADPALLYEPYYYKDVFPWRSVFDMDSATFIAEHPDCADPKAKMPPSLEHLMPPLPELPERLKKK